MTSTLRQLSSSVPWPWLCPLPSLEGVERDQQRQDRYGDEVDEGSRVDEALCERLQTRLQADEGDRVARPALQKLDGAQVADRVEHDQREHRHEVGEDLALGE